MVFSKSILFVYTMILFGFVTGCFDIEAEKTNPTDPNNPNYDPRKAANVKATDGDHWDRITISWENVKDAKKYFVFRKEEPDGEYIPIGKTKQNIFEDYNTDTLKNYSYYTVAYGLKHYWEPSETDIGYRKYPNELVLTASDGIYQDRVELKWDIIPNVQIYTVLRSVSENGTYYKIGETAEPAFIDTLAESGIKHFYRLQCSNDKSFWGPGKAEIGYKKTGQPTVVTTTRGDYPFIRISYPAASGADSYNIYRSDSEFGNYLKVGSTAGLFYDDKSALPAVYYYYKVAGYNTKLDSESILSLVGVKGICVEEMTTVKTGIVLKLIPKKRFNLGQEQIAEPVHLVDITNDYYISKLEISYNKWREIHNWAKLNGYSFSNITFTGTCGSEDNGEETQPVCSVNWFDAIKWCNALSEYENYTPYYYDNELTTSVYKTGSSTVYTKWDEVDGFRLPTEAEWENAARGNSVNIYFWGNGYYKENLTPYCWYYENSFNKTQIVGVKSSNDFGLHDIYGNAREWCFDWYDVYPYSEIINPTGSTGGTEKVLRGGSYLSYSNSLSSAYRFKLPPLSCYPNNGFRIVKKR